MRWKWKKPKWVQKAQTAASNVVKPVTTSAPIKNIQRAAQRAANTVQKKVINPVTTSKPIKNIQKVAQNAANTVAKEVGHVVNPVAGEVAMRAKDLANSKAVKQAGDAIGDGLRSFDKNVIQPVSTSKALKTIQGKAQQAADYVGDEVRNIPGSLKNMAQASQDPNKGFYPLPYFTKHIPDAVADVFRGGGRVLEGIATLDGGQFVNGLKTAGSGILGAGEHTIKGGILPVWNAMTRTTDGQDIAGRGGTQEQREAEEAANKEVVVANTPEQKETLDKLEKYEQSTWDKVKDTLKSVFDEGIKPGFDSIEVKTARTRYGDVARPEEIEVFRRAQRAGDEKLMDIMIAQWQYRQRFGRDYSDDLAKGTVYQK